MLSPDGTALALLVIPDNPFDENVVVWEWETQKIISSGYADTTVERMAFNSVSRHLVWADYGDVVAMLSAGDPPYDVVLLDYTPGVTALTFGPPAARRGRPRC